MVKRWLQKFKEYILSTASQARWKGKSLLPVTVKEENLSQEHPADFPICLIARLGHLPTPRPVSWMSYICPPRSTFSSTYVEGKDYLRTSGFPYSLTSISQWGIPAGGGRTIPLTSSLALTSGWLWTLTKGHCSSQGGLPTSLCLNPHPPFFQSRLELDELF